MPPKRALSADEEEERKRLRAENAKKRRQAESQDKRAQRLDKEANRQSQRRMNMTGQERAHERVNQANYVAIKRKNLSTSERAVYNERSLASVHQRQSTYTDTERSEFNSRHAINCSNYRERLRSRARMGTLLTAQNAHLNENIIQPHDAGKLNTICSSCNAKHFLGERPTDKCFTQCCQKGKVTLPPIKLAPFFTNLMTFKHEHSKNFHENVRCINSSLAFASMGAKLAPPPGYGPYCFRINGQIYHRSGALHPENDDQRKFAQLYILDPEVASAQRLSLPENTNCNPILMNELSTFIAQNNPFADACKMLYEVENESIQDVKTNNLEPPKVSMAIFKIGLQIKDATMHPE